MTDHPSSDLDRLIDAALRRLDEENPDPDADNPMVELHLHQANAATLAAAIALCKSADQKRRRLGADILAQLGHSSSNPLGLFRETRFAALEETLRNEITTTDDPGVLRSVLTAFSHMKDPRAIPLGLELIGHKSADVRFGVVQALMGHEDEAAIAGLIRLSSDDDSDVRDWATFALGQMIDTDSAPIRSALHARLDDTVDDVKNEAIEGLASRGDRTVLPVLIRELEVQLAEPLLAAACHFADPTLCPALAIAGKQASEAKALGERLAGFWESRWRDAAIACSCPVNEE